MRNHFIVLLSIMGGLIAPAMAQDKTPTPLRYDLAARNYDAACASSHYRGAGKTPFGMRGPPASSNPDELVQVILFGKSSDDDEGSMPGFAHAFTGADMARLVTWMRANAKPDAPWPNVELNVTHMRSTGKRED